MARSKTLTSSCRSGWPRAALLPPKRIIYAARCPAPAKPATGKVDEKIHEVKGGAHIVKKSERTENNFQSLGSYSISHKPE